MFAVRTEVLQTKAGRTLAERILCAAAPAFSYDFLMPMTLHVSRFLMPSDQTYGMPA